MINNNHSCGFVGGRTPGRITCRSMIERILWLMIPGVIYYCCVVTFLTAARTSHAFFHPHPQRPTSLCHDPLKDGGAVTCITPFTNKNEHFLRYRDIITNKQRQTTNALSRNSNEEHLEPEWSAHLDELRQYKERNGHCLVQSNYDTEHNSELAAWVRIQRRQHKLFQEGDPSSLTTDRIKALNKIGFHWNVMDADFVWERYYNELRTLYQNNQKDAADQNSDLCEWMSHQREEYRRFKWRRSSSLTKERIGKLNAIGFSWRRSVPRLPWSGRYAQLEEFQGVHKHCRVPERYEKNPSLGSWVVKQREEYKKYITEGAKSRLTDKRVEKLNEIKFEWVLQTQNRTLGWNERFQELKEFKELYGTCNVPNSYKDKPGLGLWVANQRTGYRYKKQGKDTALSEDRINQLNGLGFEWRLIQATDWDDRYEELCQFKKKHGHSNVPIQYKPNLPLARWVFTQRRYYKTNTQKSSPLSDERIAKLDRLDFQWRLIVDWDARFSQLREFYETHGHCRVPGSNKPHCSTHALARWVIKQREQYRFYIKGNKKSILNEERIAKLESIEFQWSIKKAPSS